MNTKPSPREFNKRDREFMDTLDERQRRRYAATQAMAIGCHGVCKVSEFFGIDQKTVYSGIMEIRNNSFCEPGRVRRKGGGRKRELDRHPEWIEVFRNVTAPYTAGLPQDGEVVWISLAVPEISAAMKAEGCPVSDYIVRQILKVLGYRRRSFSKSATMKDVPLRDEQFRLIEEIRTRCAGAGLPVLSVDTKKKELIGNFRRAGKVLADGSPQCWDHDFETFAEAKIVPHGIYDVASNTGYLTVGNSHDTSEFVCDNIERVWEEHLHDMYPDAGTMVLLCDGGGSNSSSHRIVKQDFMDLADRLGMNIMVVHYPPYCSKFNPIEHRLFSQITRSWSGAPLTSVANAADRAAGTTTKTGLKVHVHIEDKPYGIKRAVRDDFSRRLSQQVVFREDLPKWNYLIRPA